jgi:hypothetical protein
LWLVALTDFKTCFVVEHPKHCLRISCNASPKKSEFNQDQWFNGLQRTA